MQNSELSESGEIPQEAVVEAPTAAELALRDLPDALLASELQRRGWIVVEP